MAGNYYYFDSNYLKQYLAINRELKVFVDGQYLSIPDQTSVIDPEVGYGYDEDGQEYTFSYPDIQTVKSGNFTMDIKTLQDRFKDQDSEEAPEDGEEAPEDGAEGEPSGGASAALDEPEGGGEEPEGGEEAPKDEAPPKEEEPPKESYMAPLNRFNHLIQETEKRRYGKKDSPMLNRLAEIVRGDYVGTKGTIIGFEDDTVIIRSTNYTDRLRPGVRIAVDINEVQFN